jgi:hypothetical protein
MMHPHTALREVDSVVGLGVFATAFIPRGTVVWVRDGLDQVVDDARLAALPPLLQAQVERYAHVDGQGRRVLCWDHARYMNHACDPSTTSVGTLMEIARRDLAPGDALTCEYGLDYITAAFPCACGSAGCRGTLVPEDAAAQRRRWDLESQAAFDAALRVEQPVLAAASADDPGRFIIDAILARRPMRLPSWLEGTPGG